MYEVVGIFVLFLSITFIASPAISGVTIEEYLKNKNDIEMKMYITGLEEGIFIASINFKVTYGKELYCQPKKLAVVGHNYINILDSQIEKSRGWIEEKGWMNRQSAIGQLLIDGLQETFPCKEQ